MKDLRTVELVVLRSVGMFTVMSIKMTVMWDVGLRNHLSRSWINTFLRGVGSYVLLCEDHTFSSYTNKTNTRHRPTSLISV